MYKIEDSERGGPMIDNTTDEYIWEKERMVLTWQQLHIPGLEMIGRCQSVRNCKPLPLHYHRDCMEIVYVVSGSQTYYMGGRRYAVRGNQLFITPADMLHSTGDSPHGRYEIYWMRLYKEYCPGFLQMSNETGKTLHHALFSLKNPVICPMVSLKKSITEAFSLLTSDLELERIRGCALLQEFISQVCISETITADVSDEILQATEYVAEHVFEVITLEELAQAAEMSLSRLKQRFQSELGISPREYINLIKIEKAKELLKDKSKTVTDIAFALSFSSSNYFSLVFRQLTGKSPTDFRQENSL